jgi:hypothetical protein
VTPKEAAEAIGYNYVATVFADLRAGRLRARRDGSIRPESVASRIKRRDADHDRNALFLKPSLTPEEQATLSKPRPKIRD